MYALYGVQRNMEYDTLLSPFNLKIMIKIHFDFTDGTEVSYLEGCELKDNFTTNCLDFFNNDEDVNDVVVIDKDGNTLSRKLLMTKGDTTYTNRDMREAHNLQKMLKGDAFNWR